MPVVKLPSPQPWSELKNPVAMSLPGVTVRFVNLKSPPHAPSTTDEGAVSA
jgi:hypothetical protein